MKFHVMPESLRAQLERCSKVAGSDGANRARRREASLKPVYDHVLIRNVGTFVTMRVADPHVYFDGRLNCDTSDEDGEALVDCDRFTQIIKIMAEGALITLQTNAEFLTIKQGEFKAQLPLMRGETIDEIKMDGPFPVEFDFTASMLAGVNRCGAVIEETPNGFRPGDPFQGVLFEYGEDGVLWIAGFSSTLLYATQFVLPEGVKAPPFRFVLAKRALGIFSGFPGGLPMKFAFDEEYQKVILTSSECAVRSCIVEDSYPKNYQKFLGMQKMTAGVFPVTKLDAAGVVTSEVDRVPLRFDRAQFITCLGSASCVLGGEDNVVELRLVGKMPDNRRVVELFGQNRFNKAEARAKLIAESDTNIELIVGLHYGKIRECLKNMSGEYFLLHMLGQNDLLVLQEESDKNFAAFSIPLRIS